MRQDIAIFTPMANEEKNAKKFVLEVLSYQKFFRKFKTFNLITFNYTIEGFLGFFLLRQNFF